MPIRWHVCAEVSHRLPRALSLPDSNNKVRACKRKHRARTGVSHVHSQRITAMTTLDHSWSVFWDYFRQGLPHINLLLGIAIAVVGGMMVGSLFGLIVIALLAVIVHVLAEAIIPMVLNHAAFALPA